MTTNKKPVRWLLADLKDTAVILGILSLILLFNLIALGALVFIVRELYLLL